jgi:predicted metal-dependent hydrolase
MNHSSRFWAEVAAVLPDYTDSRNWLKEHGTSLLARLPQMSDAQK